MSWQTKFLLRSRIFQIKTISKLSSDLESFYFVVRPVNSSTIETAGNASLIKSMQEPIDIQNIYIARLKDIKNKLNSKVALEQKAKKKQPQFCKR